ncbi:MAG TPA: hypothetical protein VIT22_01135, partial [Pseudoxanthomonas sp.]
MRKSSCAGFARAGVRSRVPAAVAGIDADGELAVETVAASRVGPLPGGQWLRIAAQAVAWLNRLRRARRVQN